MCFKIQYSLRCILFDAKIDVSISKIYLDTEYIYIRIK
jgi:hypothetical protein